MSHLKKFSVVYFPSDKTIEVVPSKWILEDRQKCPFPINLPTGFRKIQKDSSSTPDPNWPIWEVELKKSYDDFSAADAKAKKLLSALYVDSSENDAVQNVNPTVENNSGEDQGNVDVTNLFPPNITFEDQRLTTLINEFRGFQAVSSQNQLILQEEIREVKSMLLRSTNSGNTQSRTAKDTLWPLRNAEDLKRVDEILKNPDIFNEQVLLLSGRGDTDATKTVNFFLKSIIQHEFALQLRFTSDSGKVPFKGTNCCKLVREAVQKYFYLLPTTSNIQGELTESKLNSQIAKWLRDSINRGEEGKENRAKYGKAKVNTVATGQETTEQNVDDH
ncbi:hypothetical protein Fcan01_18276 [Folsomia candida]|uniref:DUF4806 domain-containing protein n=1 Tax=Folsomia candida TaxID=158441 RepID=A0A226DPA3_FOLCA|nr:hypothetical protein Fcan01_18276 [Folsomia candida]